MTRVFKTAITLSVVSAAALFAHTEAVGARQATERTVYVSVMDGNGAPVGDMKQNEFAVTADGQPRSITKVERASEPLHYAILIDTTPAAARAVNDVREGVKAFTQLLLSADPRTQFQLMDFGGAAMTVQEFTSDQSALEAGLGKLLPKPSEPVMNEALVEVAKQMAAMPDGSRRVILSINMEPTRESTNIQVRQVAEEVRKSGAVVWAVSLQEGARRDANREQMLKGLAANTGGRWIVLQGPAQTNLGAYLRSIAANSFSQYAVTFAVPDGAVAAKVTDVTVTRPGVSALSMKWSNQ